MPKLLKNLGAQPEEWVKHAVEKALVEQDGWRVDPGWHHPSDQANPCLRYKQWRFIGYPASNAPDPHMIFAAKMGTFIHQLMGELLHEHPRVLSIEEGKADEVNRVRGTSDKRITDHDGVMAILDWKSVNALPTEPRPKDKMQLAWYLYLNGQTRAVVYYITRTIGAMRRYTMSWHELRPIWEASKDAVVTVNDLTEREELAPRTPLNRTQCGTCPFLDDCDETERGADRWKAYVTQAAQWLRPQSAPVSITAKRSGKRGSPGSPT